MKLIFSPQALKDLENIGDYIAQESPARARTFVIEIGIFDFENPYTMMV